MKKFTSIEETEQTIKLLQQRQEIESELSFHKRAIENTADLIKHIDDRINKGYTIIKSKFLFFSSERRIMLDDYDISTLKIQQTEEEYKLEKYKNFYEHWMKRDMEYRNKFNELSKEYDECFEDTLAKAKRIKNPSPALIATIPRFEKEDMLKDDKRLKIDFYLFIKQEVENAIKDGQKF